MVVNLGALPSNSPLPVGQITKLRGDGNNGTIGWPAAENFLYANYTSQGMQRGPFRSTQRFWLACGASGIYLSPGAWTRYDYELRLVVNGSYGNDLNGINFFQQCDNMESTNHNDAWVGWDVEGKFFCEANTDYIVYLLSKGGSGSYYISSGHLNMWAYTVSEGVY